MENNKISTDATRRFQDVGKIFCPTMFMDIDKLLTKKRDMTLPNLSGFSGRHSCMVFFSCDSFKFIGKFPKRKAN